MTRSGLIPSRVEGSNIMAEVRLTFIGHSTALIEGNGGAILTDPVFTSHLFHLKRQGPLNWNPANLPPLTAVLLSHTHLDHLNFESFAYIKTSVPIIVPEGSGAFLSRNLRNPVIELSHWANHEIAGVKIHAMPAIHRNRPFSIYWYKQAMGYVIEIDSKTIFFSGDTAYGTHFRDIGNTFSIDTALLAVGAYKPLFYMKYYHMNPQEAVQAFFDLKAKTMIPIHWGAFRLGLEKIDEPIEWLQKLISEHALPDRIKILASGESIII